MIEATYTQCKQLSDLGDMRGVLASMSDQPDWILEPLSIADIQAVQQGGCASGAYMPAVTYHQALMTMGEHGDDVMAYIVNHYGELPDNSDASWSHLAVFYLSIAVELWCGRFDLDGVNWD